jgi:CheY-like chemotaxis protein/two-component sensor histidine kinase
VINDILDMSKIEANKFELSEVEFSFEKMLRKVTDVINFRVEEKHQDFKVFIDPHIPRSLLGDDQRLAQVITNLLSNAVKFTPEKGSIRLDACLEGGDGESCSIRVSVADTGIGISAEQQKRLFSAFEQAESNTARKFGGTGLGLALSKRIVELMGGRIWIESAPGKGSTFTFIIRVRPGKENKSGPPRPKLNRDNIRVLVVDDEPDILEFFKDISARAGFSCDTAGSGEDAIGLIGKSGAYDICFVDWKMPGMNGIELSRSIKAKSGGKSVVIMISATEWSVIEPEAKKAGVDKFLPKPLFPSSISDCIEECLDLSPLPEDEPGAAETGILKGRHLLLVEDMEINREIVLALFEPAGPEIDCAENGVEAVSMFKTAPGRYDAIFMDVQMPEMDGYEATRRIRAIEAEPSSGQGEDEIAAHIPIIAMSANVFREDIEKCLEAGMDDHVGKPLDFTEVIEKLCKYLR